MRVLFVSGLLLAVGLAGCFGFDPSGGFDFVPGEDWEPTGKEVRLKSQVVDWIFHEVYPGFHANLWAFCFAPQDPNDSYSLDAIEPLSSLETDGVVDDAYSLSKGESCGVPGPTLRVQQGDRVVVEFNHSHFHCHTIHWHGQHLPWKEDGVPGATQDSQCKESAEPFVYDFYASRAGTLWYHCHVDVQFHVMQGLYGMIIVEPQNKAWEPKDIDREHILVYSTLRRDLVQLTPARIDNPHIEHNHVPGQCGASGTQGCKNPSVDVTADTWLTNGRSAPHTMMDRNDTVLIVEKGERIRLRMLNAGETVETIHTHGHDMHVTHRDGNPLPPDARFFVDTLTIGPAERYDVVMEFNNPGIWVFHSHVDSHNSNDGQARGGTLSAIAYKSSLGETGGAISSFGGVEAFGGKPYTTPLAIPPDQFNGTEEDIQPDFAGGSTDARVSETFPVAMPCAVRSLTVTATYEPEIPGLGDNMQLRVIDGDGRDLIDEDNRSLGADDRIRVVLHPTDDVNKVAWFSGTFEAIVTGQNAFGLISLDIDLDYLESEDDFEFSTRVLGGTECDPALRVFDPLTYTSDAKPEPGKPEGAQPPQ